MLTYQIRPRIFRTDGTPFPSFPLKGEIRFHFAPRQPFGVEPGGGRTAVKSVAAKVLFNANTGEHFIESSAPLRALDLTLVAPEQLVRLEGSRLTVSQSFESLKSVAEFIEGIYRGGPGCLNTELASISGALRV